MKSFSITLDEPYCKIIEVSYDVENLRLYALYENGTVQVRQMNKEEVKELFDATIRSLKLFNTNYFLVEV